MKFQVFDNGKPADSTGYPQLKRHGWANSTFDTAPEAIAYALSWLGEYGEGVVLEIGKPYVYDGYTEIEIRETQSA